MAEFVGKGLIDKARVPDGLYRCQRVPVPWTAHDTQVSTDDASTAAALFRFSASSLPLSVAGAACSGDRRAEPIARCGRRPLASRSIRLAGKCPTFGYGLFTARRRHKIRHPPLSIRRHCSRLPTKPASIVSFTPSTAPRPATGSRSVVSSGVRSSSKPFLPALRPRSRACERLIAT